MLKNLIPRELRRKQYLYKAKPGPLRDFYSHVFVRLTSKFSDLSYAVLDFETTGLDVKNDHVVSIGYVEINQLGIELGSAWHQVIKTSRDLPEASTVIHQLTDDVVAKGMELEEAIALLLNRLQGKVLIAHHAQIELKFLNKITQAFYQLPFMMPVIDTQLMAKRQLQRQGVEIEQGTLRLFNLCSHYGLPPYKAHNALNDSIATAELFLLLLNELYPKLDGRLRDLCRPCFI